MQVAATVVPVANVLAAGDRWTVLSWLPGVPLTEAGSGGLFSAARALGRIASVQLPSAGWITRDQGIRAFSFGGSRGFLAARLASPATGDRLGSSRLRKIHRVVVSQRSRLEQMDSQHCLVHGDFNPTNILISEGLVSGILDWEFSHSGCPWMDVGNLLRHTDAALRPEIARGLEAGGMTLSADWQPWARLADLSAHLQFLDVGDTPADLVEGSLQWLERFVEDFDPGENG